MKPQEALAQALDHVDWMRHYGPRITISGPDSEDIAAAILDALPEGWALTDATTGILNQMHRCGEECGAQQEREWLRATMAKWDGDDWANLPQNERIATLLAHHEDDR